MEGIYTNTTDTFTTADGTTVKYEDIFRGILSNVEYYAVTGGRGLGEAAMKDIFQNAALKAIVSHGTYDPRKGARPVTWGSRIAGNCEKDTFNSETRHGATFSSLEEMEEEGRPVDACVICGHRGDEYEADAEIRAEEAEAHIMDKVENLCENYRLVIGLKIQGLKDSEMAEVMGWKPEKVHRTLCRARKALAMALGEEFMSEHGVAA